MTTITYTDGYLHVSTDTGDSCFQASKAEVLKFVSTLRLEYKLPALTEDYKPVFIDEMAVGDFIIYCFDERFYYGQLSCIDLSNEVLRICDVHTTDGMRLDNTVHVISPSAILAVYRYYGEPQKNGLYKDTDGKYFWRYSYGGADERPWIKLTGASPEWTFFDDIRYVIKFPLTMIAEME